MKRLHLLLSAGLGAGILGLASPAVSQDLPALETALQAVLDSVVDAGSTPGVMMRIDAPSMGFSWSGVAGVADTETGAPLMRTNAVRIASNTKTYVAAAILRLWEEGRLGLDDPLSMHLPPEYAEVLEGDGYDLEAITIRHLLTHTSGLYDYADRDLFVEAVLADPTHRWTPEEQIDLAVEWGDPYGAAGEVYRYSDTGYVVLGLVLQSVYGKPLAPSLRELLDFEGLELGSTWLETLEDPPPGASDRAHQYMGELDTYDFDPSLDLYGGGGLVSTADDMAVFMRALFMEGVYRDAATADTMLTTVAGAGAGPDLSGSPMVPGRYRMGVEVRDLGGLEVYMHTGFWGTLAAYFPGQDIAISIAVTQQQSRALFRVFIDALTVLQESIDAAPAEG
ncbi:MAG: beta-lactamase family protein [marine benthic group bacterium]|nr:beta-lactamase family protein [Gemmatimonadota bacterium]